MHLLVAGGQGLQLVAPHAVQLQLEGRSRFQVAVDGVLGEVVPSTVSEELGELASVRGKGQGFDLKSM